MKRPLISVVSLALLAGCQQPAAPVDERPAPDFLSMVTSARVVELNFTWSNEAPLLPLNPPFAMSLAATHAATAGSVPGGIAFAGDTMQFSGQHGAPTIDALGHISNGGKLYGGLDAKASESPAGLTALGIERYPRERLVNRGVLLDVARFKGVDALDAGYEVTPADLEGTVERQGVEIRAGDSVLIRTGYGRFFESDKERYLGFRPGIGAAGAEWLGARNVFLTGMDTLTYDVAPEAGTEFPAHRMLIADRGIYIVENMNLDALGEALAGTSGEFVLVLNPLRIKGATASPLNAFALLP